MLRLRSAERPFSDVAVAGQAARLLALAEALGLWQPHDLVETVNRNVFAEALEAVAAAGVAQKAPFDWVSNADASPQDFATWIKTLREDIAGSPVPELELPRLDTLFGTERLARSVGVASSSMRRYVAHEREAPDEVAARAHLLAQIVSDLVGSYNERGIRRWFQRPRSQLGGRAPEDILSGRWDPDDPEVAEVAELAAERAG
jgi:uncharacterized protein (DUF2384 family)